MFRFHGIRKLKSSVMNEGFKFKLNRAGVRELLKSPEIASAVREAGERVRDNAGRGFSLNSQSGKRRTIVRVYAYTKEAIRDAYDNNALLKALR